MNYYDILAIVLGFIFTLGLFLIILSFYFKDITKNISQISKRFANSIHGLVVENLEQNKYLYKDRIRIERLLTFWDLRIKNKPITFRGFVYFSFLASLMGFGIAFITTSRIGSLNIPALTVGLIVGFIGPRWYLIIIEGRSRRLVASEIPQAIAKITDFTRLYSNMERAVLEATKEMPKTTRKYFQIAWNQRKSGYYKSFIEMMYEFAKGTKNQLWIDFAHICLIDTTLGSSDRIGRLRSLQARSRKMLLASKLERKELNAKLVKLLIAYVFLVAIWIFETVITPSLGVYLYTTAVGRLLMTCVYVTFTFNAALFTWLYYNN